MKSIADEISDLRDLSTERLVARYESAFGRPPRVKHREWLWKRIAWKLQEERMGGISSAAKQRLEALIAEIHIPLDEHTRTVTGRLTVRPKPTLTATLTRTWRGREIRATPVEGGYEVDGVLYRSLSAAARAITGSNWNGRLFFGLTVRKSAR